MLRQKPLDAKNYVEKMVSYDEELANLTKPIWENIYLNHQVKK
jgi:hypothetical protein